MKLLFHDPDCPAGWDIPGTPCMCTPRELVFASTAITNTAYQCSCGTFVNTGEAHPDCPLMRLTFTVPG